MNINKWIAKYGKGSDRSFPATKPTVATTAEPGTPEKVEVMFLRREAGEELFHPDDLNAFADYLERCGRGRGPLHELMPKECYSWEDDVEDDW